MHWLRRTIVLVFPLFNVTYWFEEFILWVHMYVQYVCVGVVHLGYSLLDVFCSSVKGGGAQGEDGE